MNATGTIPLPAEPDARANVAARLAGLLAELGVAELTMTDPRHCAIMHLPTRQTDLPAMIVGASPGVIFATAKGSLGPVVELLIDEHAVRYAVDEHAAADFRQLAGQTA